jgi:hypothetical protein
MLCAFLKGHFITIFAKRGLECERRVLSNTRMREVVTAIRRSFDPDVTWPERSAGAQGARSEAPLFFFFSAKT